MDDNDLFNIHFEKGDIIEVDPNKIEGHGEDDLIFGAGIEDTNLIYIIVGVLLIAIIVVMYTADGPFGPNKPFRQVWGNAWK